MSLRSRTRQGYPLSSFLSIIVLEKIDKARKINKGSKTVSIHRQHNGLYKKTESPKKSTQKNTTLLQLISEFSNIEKYKIHL